MYYAPETLPRAQALLSASADIEVRYELALERADRWPGRPEVKARRISRLVVSRNHERAVIRKQIEGLQREWFSGRASPLHPGRAHTTRWRETDPLQEGSAPLLGEEAIARQTLAH